MKKIDPNFLIIAAAVGVGIYYAIRRMGSGVVDGWGRFVDAVNFDPESLGPNVELTDTAKGSKEWYIEQGYLEILPNGSSRITEAGEAYIAENQAGQ